MVSEEEFQLVRAAGFLAAAGLATGLQLLSPHARVRGSWQVNLGLWAVNLVVMGTVCGACACTAARWASRHDLGLLNLIEVPAWAAVVSSVVMLDLVSYGWHRMNHVLPFLWRFHQVHHSDAVFTTSTGVRFHPGELVLSLPVRLAAVVAVGAPAVGVVVFEVVFAIANLVEHGDIDCPRWLERHLERLFVTPALHRRHHGNRAVQLGSNFGTVFSFWDRVLGSYGHSTSATQVTTGLSQLPGGLGVLVALRLPISPTRASAPR